MMYLTKCPNCDLSVACEGSPPFYCPDPKCGCQIHGFDHLCSEKDNNSSKYDDYDSEGRSPDDLMYGHISDIFPTKDDCWQCPRCLIYTDDHPALSRFDTKTHVCPDCGIEEAMIENRFQMLMKKVG